MKYSFIYILLSLVGLQAFSQTVIIGKVTQEQGESLPGANVYLQGTYDGTSVNEKGQFSVQEVILQNMVRPFRRCYCLTRTICLPKISSICQLCRLEWK